MIRHEEVFQIGRLTGAHGLKGYVDMYYTDDIFTSDGCDYLVLEIDGLLVPFFVEDWQVRNDELASVKFEGYDDKDSVQLIQNTSVFYPKSAITEERRELASWQMLTGFEVSDSKSGKLGRVIDVDDSSANILLSIRTPEGKEIVLPVHPDLVNSLDVNNRTITLDLPNGILEL